MVTSRWLIVFVFNFLVLLASCGAAPDQTHQRYKRQLGLENFAKFFQTTWESFKRDIWEPTKKEYVAPAFDAYVKPILNNVIKEGHEQWMSFGERAVTAANEALDSPHAPVTVGEPIQENTLLKGPPSRVSTNLAQQPDVIVLDELRPSVRRQP